MAPQIVAFWIGGRLTAIEQLSLRSFVQNGHPVALYHYQPLSGVPDGVELRSADEVVPYWYVKAFLGDARPSLIANWFRLLLMRRGAGIWVDTDVVCIRPIACNGPFLAGWESEDYINNAVLYLEPESVVLRGMLDAFGWGGMPEWVPFHRTPLLHIKHRLGMTYSPASLPRGTFGPKGLTAVAARHGKLVDALPPEVFYPLHPRQADTIFNTRPLTSVITDRTQAIHLWNEKIRARKDETPVEGSILQQLMDRYRAA